MKAFNHIFLFIAVSLLFSNCNKEDEKKGDPVLIKAYAINLATGDSTPGVKIRLRRDAIAPGSSAQLRGYEELIDSTITDERGYFEFLLPNGRDIYGLEPIAEGYWYNPGMYITKVGGWLQTKTVQVNLYPLTYMRVRIRNSQPIGENDSIFYEGPIDESPRFVLNYQNATTYVHRFSATGSQFDTTIFITTRYDLVPQQYWDVTKNGQTIRSFAYWGCNPLDTCNYLIEY
jgi:hypothetical protein